MMQLSDLTLEDIFLKITMGETVAKKPEKKINISFGDAKPDTDDDEAPASESENENGGEN